MANAFGEGEDRRREPQVRQVREPSGDAVAAGPMAGGDRGERAGGRRWAGRVELKPEVFLEKVLARQSPQDVHAQAVEEDENDVIGRADEVDEPARRSRRVEVLDAAERGDGANEVNEVRPAVRPGTYENLLGEELFERRHR